MHHPRAGVILRHSSSGWISCQATGILMGPGWGTKGCQVVIQRRKMTKTHGKESFHLGTVVHNHLEI